MLTYRPKLLCLETEDFAGCGLAQKCANRSLQAKQELITE